VLAIAAVALLVARTVGQSESRVARRIVAAGPEVDVSRDPRVQSQVSIAVDPTNDRVLVAGSGNWGRKTRAYSSTDGGSTWTASAVPPLPAGVPQTCAFGDSTVGIDRLGRQYYAFIVGLTCSHIGSAVGTPELFVARRADATASWKTPASPVAALFPGNALLDGEADDKPWLSVDVSPASPHTKRVYVVWTRSGGAEGIRVLLSHSDDGARSWSAPVRLNDRSLADGAIASVAVGGDGDVYVTRGRHHCAHDLDRPLDGWRPALRSNTPCHERAEPALGLMRPARHVDRCRSAPLRHGRCERHRR